MSGGCHCRRAQARIAQASRGSKWGAVRHSLPLHAESMGHICCGTEWGLWGGIAPSLLASPSHRETPVLRCKWSVLGRLGRQPTRPQSCRLRPQSGLARPRRRATATDGVGLPGASRRLALLSVGDPEASLRADSARLVRPSRWGAPGDARRRHSGAGHGSRVPAADEDRLKPALVSGSRRCCFAGANRS